MLSIAYILDHLTSEASYDMGQYQFSRLHLKNKRYAQEIQIILGSIQAQLGVELKTLP